MLGGDFKGSTWLACSVVARGARKDGFGDRTLGLFENPRFGGARTGYKIAKLRVKHPTGNTTQDESAGAQLVTSSICASCT